MLFLLNFSLTEDEQSCNVYYYGWCCLRYEMSLSLQPAHTHVKECAVPGGLQSNSALRVEFHAQTLILRAMYGKHCE